MIIRSAREPQTRRLLFLTGVQMLRRHRVLPLGVPFKAGVASKPTTPHLKWRYGVETSGNQFKTPIVGPTKKDIL